MANSAFSPLGISAVSAVSNSDGTLTISPTTGAVVASLNIGHSNGWTAQQYSATSALTFGSTVNWDLNTAQSASLLATSNIPFTMAAPTNMKDGGTYTFKVTQFSTGGQVITWNAVFKFPGGTKFVLSTANNAVDIITFLSDGTSMFAVGQAAFS